MRPIEADALKKALDEQMNFEENCRDSVFGIIDKAPTIIPSYFLNLNDITEEDIVKFKAMWQRANSKGLLPLVIEADPKSGDLISREDAKKNIQQWLVKERYYHPNSRRKTIPIEEVLDVLDNTISVAPKFKPVCEVAFDKEELKRIVDENLDKILQDLSQYREGVVNKASDNDCENCKFQAKLPTQEPCYCCSYCYTSKFEPKDGSEPDMMTNDKLCDECEEKCDWYKETIKKGNMPIGCTQQIAPENEDRMEDIKNGES